MARIHFVNDAAKRGGRTLLPVRENVQVLVDSLAARLQLDVEIVDTRLNRIGASGNFRRLVGSRQERGFINRHVVETGKPVLISNPGREHLCSPCDLKNQCAYRAGLACPITHQGHVVGVFSLMGLSEWQRDLLHQGGDRLLQLVAHLSSSLVAGQLFPSDPFPSPPLPYMERPQPHPRRTHGGYGRARPSCNSNGDPFAAIVGRSEALQRTVEKTRRLAKSGAVVLLSGETGTGKEMFARAIHACGRSEPGPLVTVNCSAIPETLLESELFGYEEGAFTGARRGGKVGKFELADGGTLFLDEVGELPLSLQPKLLRVLEYKTVDRVGGTVSQPISIRVIAATNRDLRDLVRKGQFRADLYYRLCGLPVHIPPLRERRQDIGPLAEHFLAQVDRDQGLAPRRWHPDALAAMAAYDWPGNVRELKNAVEYAATMAEGAEIPVCDLPDEVQSVGNRTLQERLEAYERELLVCALAAAGRHVEGKREVAESMGVSLPTLYRRLKELNLCPQ